MTPISALSDDYPELYESAEGEVPDGWVEFLRSLSFRLHAYIGHRLDKDAFRVTYAGVKCGRLVFCMNKHQVHLAKLVAQACDTSEYLCEICGLEGQQSLVLGETRSMCAPCQGNLELMDRWGV